MQKSPASSLALVAAGVAVLLSACATTRSTPDDTTLTLQMAENSIRAAEQQQAAQFAALELTSAKTKLGEAQQAATQDQDRTAQRRAEEALADAELASAKSNLSLTLNQGAQLQSPQNPDGIQTMPATGAR